jgi:nitrite reductase/ring-hydroxylating ferredoxin subunit
MKQFFYFIFILSLFSCEKNNVVNNNQYIQNVSFSINIDTNLPTYNSLQFPSNPILITIPGAGVKGIIVMKAGVSDYKAYEASCPNQYPSACSQLVISGINAKCDCDAKEYNLYTGVANNAQYPLKAYAVEILGTTLRVYN